MKKLCYLFLVLTLLAFAALSASAYEHEDFYKGAGKGEVLNVFNWGEYISDSYEDGMRDVNREFEKLTGIKVNYVTFESNEDMYAKIKNGGVSYDIVVPSDYMIERMVAENLLQPFDTSALPNYHYIDAKYKNMYYDPDNTYSVPYNVGMVGLIYNTKMVEGTPDSWAIMWDEKYAGKILMIDNPRDAMAIPQKLLGYSFNDTDLKQLDDVAQMLIDQKPLLQSYVMDEVYNKMESGEAALVPYYVGDYITMRSVNPDLAFVYPKEGVNIFVDAMCIPRTAQNVDAALKYINFMLDPEIALDNAFYIGYASPNTAVVENEDYAEYAEDQFLYPDEEHMPNVEYFHNLPQETLKRYSELWNQIKMAGGTDKRVYVGFAVTGVVIVTYLVWQYVVKRRREHWYDFPES
ncbi:MAG: spermidine/putrescine ABC transporter substrate-binding protein [Clostridia bacterium]|nr:spermidine/putrescine ABC transporter substrate-binding protein [Clostridia bacterium]MBQ4365483.1 spermidine/putrescine ABC transporter substrate-binding protein [Clostridia bacterium]